MALVVRPYAFVLLALSFAFMGAWRTAIAEDFADPRARANRLCESYGRGFIAGDAPGHCVKVQERLRVEPDHRHVMSDPYGAPVFAPVQDAPLRNRLRLNGGFGPAAVH